MADENDLIAVRLRLQGARQFVSEAGAGAAAILGFGEASEEAAAKTRLANLETRALQQGMYTLRRYAFYGTSAVLAFAGASLKLGLSFDEAKSGGTAAFTAILGGARAANLEMNTLIGLTHETGVGLGLLTSEAEQMQGFGFTLKEINVDLAALAQYAERSGRGAAGLTSLVEVFDRIRQSGRLTSLDLRTLNTQGISGLQILTRQLHLTTAQARALQAGRLVIPAQYALPALASGIGARAGQLGTNFGQQAGITHSYLSSLLGGGEQGAFSFVTHGLERVNQALKAASNGGGARGFFLSLDPSGRLMRDWTILTGDVRAFARAFVNVWNVVRQGQPLLAFLLGTLGFVAKQTTLVRFALEGLAYWYLITRTRLLLFTTAEAAWVLVMKGAWVAMRAFYVAETLATSGMWLLNIAMDANPIGLIIIGVAALAGGLYLLIRRFDSVRHAAKSAWDWVNKPLFNWGDLNPWKHGFGLHVPGLAGGGTATRSGWSVVGENGPELHYLQRGASVVPLSAAGPGGGMVLEQHIYIDGDEVTNAVVRTKIRRDKIANAVVQAQGLAGARA